MKTNIPITFGGKVWGDGLYSVANAMGIESYVTKTRKIYSRDSSNIPLLTKWLIEDGYDYGIDVIFYDYFGYKITGDTLNLRSGDDNRVLPVLLQVQSSDGALPYIIGGRIDNDGDIYIYDTWNKYVEVVPFKEINEVYHKVIGLFVFTFLHEGKDFVYLNI